MSLAPGDRLGAYEIVGRIGAGGMGEVYRARDTRLDRTVAIKVLADDLAADSDLRQRFEREARTVAALSHPHICVVHDVGHHNGSGFIVMEYLDGQALADRLREGPLPIEQVFRYAIQIAQALGKAHHHGITHRDIKPGNVMLGKSGVKLLDFGLAKLQDTVAMSDVTKRASPETAHGVVLGTLQYMAPEQMRGEPTDARTDIFAFGALVYEMVSGVRAFAGNDPATVTAATLSIDPQPLASLRPETPPALDRLVRQCLAKNPDDRWQSIRDVELELVWLQERPPDGPAARPTRSSYFAWLTAAAAAAFAVAAVLIDMPRGPSETLPSVARFELATPFTSEPASFAVSPDGQQLVFTAVSDGVQKLWLRRLNQFDSQPIGGTERGVDPFWSPDGRSIGFFADGKLKRLDLGGGAPQVLADAPTPRGASWSTDGTIIFTPTTVSPLMRVPADGGTPREATALTTGQNSHRWPQFMPDGRHFIFLSTFGAPETQGIFISALDANQIIRVLNENSPAAYANGRLLYVKLGALVGIPFDPASGKVSGELAQIEPLVGFDASLIRAAFSVSTSGVLAFRGATAAPRQFVWLDRSGKILGALGDPDPGAPAAPELTADGRRLAIFRTQQSNADIWLVPVAAGVPTRLTFDPNTDIAAVWSHDGQKLYFSSARSGPVALFEHAVSGATSDRAIDPTASESRIANAVSPDGRYLLYTSLAQKTGVDLWAMPTNGDKSFALLQAPFDEMAGQISPNGRWLAYQSNATGRIEVYVTSFPAPGAQHQVSRNGGGQARWSADGRELFYVGEDGRMMAVPASGQNERELEIGTPVALFPTAIASGTNIPGAVGTRPQYAVAPDGRFLVNTIIPGGTMPPIAMVLDWRRELRE